MRNAVIGLTLAFCALIVLIAITPTVEDEAREREEERRRNPVH
jgi:hypothetical protein